MRHLANFTGKATFLPNTTIGVKRVSRKGTQTYGYRVHSNLPDVPGCIMNMPATFRVGLSRVNSEHVQCPELEHPKCMCVCFEMLRMPAGTPGL